jgi:DNA-directed RNA polymerase specialized sigma24 family protein
LWRPGRRPENELSEEEELERLHQLMSEEEWDLALARLSGLGWPELAMRFGKSADALRMRLSRILRRLRQHLPPE